MQRLSILFILALFLTSCASQRAPVPPGIVPEPTPVSQTDETYGHEVFTQLAEQFELDRDDARINRVRDIVDRLTEANGAAQDIWHVYVFAADNIKNAGATRGNYVFVWSGILQSVRDDTELATILGHEIAHVLSGHTAPDPAEEVNEMLAGISGNAVGQVMVQQGAYGVAAELAAELVAELVRGLISNPESQRKELEADQVGLYLMARAGFNPEKAVAFWDRVKDDPDFQAGTIQFLSTHPSSEERVQHLQTLLPDALQQYRDYKKGKKFTVSGSTPTVKKAPAVQPTPEKERPAQSGWTVVEPQTSVYAEPNSQSSVIGTLQQGDVVEIYTIQGRWLQINKPLAGFVRSADLSP